MTTHTFGKILYVGFEIVHILFSSRGWKDLFEADALLYSPYYPFKDHDALCMTVKVKASGSLFEGDNQEERKQAVNSNFTSIYHGHTIIN